VAKLMPALTITDEELERGLEIFIDAVHSVLR
jgi:4-aminobutyrate aminotransferase-like enzyme